MRVGIDIHHLRLDQRGIYYYLWNTIQELCRIGSQHSFSLYLYGQPWMNDPHRLACLRASFPQARLRHYWDGPALRLVSQHFQRNGNRPPRWARGIDGKVLLPLYRRALAFQIKHPAKGQLLTWPWRSKSPANAVDVFHHPAGLIFPVQPKANVMTIYDLIPVHFPDFNPEATIYFSESYAAANAMDAVIAISEHTKKDIIDHLGIAAEKIYVIPGAAHSLFRPIKDDDVLTSVLAKYDLKKGKYILYVGAMERRKNIERLVEGYARMTQADGAITHQLVLAGGGDPSVKAGIQRLVVQHHLSPSVRMLGYIPFEDLPSVICGADLFVFPSLHEGFGLPPLEAMSCGTPVVASNATSIPEVIGDAGILVDPKSTEALAQAMHQALTNRTLHAELGRRGLARAKQFSWERTARDTLVAYEEAWSRWQLEGPKRKPTFPRTKYQTRLHEWVIEQTRERLRNGSFANWSGNWP